MRGNVPTRVERVLAGEADATVLARAGLVRLGRTEALREVLDPVRFLPAPGQGALAVQCRESDGETLDLVGILDHAPTRAAVAAERAFLRRLGSGCHLAAGAWARAAGGGLRLTAFAGSVRTTELHRLEGDGTAGDAEGLGTAMAESILSGASGALLEELRAGNHPGEAAS